MRIAIMGTGGVGGYFGGLLAHAGEDVTFIARGEHLAALRREGLRVESVHGDFTLAPVQATDDPGALGPVDYVIFATKTYHIEQATEAMRPLIGPQTTVLPLHNGVDSAERIGAILGPGPVVGGVCYVGSMIAAPGVIRQQSRFRRVVAGELQGPPSERVERIIAALRDAGATAEVAPDIQKVRWHKFTFIAPFSGAGAVTRAPAGAINAVPETRALLAQAIREVEAVARAQGINLDPGIAEETIQFCANLEPGMTASMQRDVLDGRPSELESMIGVIVRKGAELGVDVPAFRFFYAALLPQERRARGEG